MTCAYPQTFFASLDSDDNDAGAASSASFELQSGSSRRHHHHFGDGVVEFNWFVLLLRVISQHGQIFCDLSSARLKFSRKDSIYIQHL